MAGSLAMGTKQRAPGSKGQSWLAQELQTALRSGSGEKRAEVALRLVDRLVTGSSELDAYALADFDHAISRLIGQVEPLTRAEIAERLAHSAPPCPRH